MKISPEILKDQGMDVVVGWLDPKDEGSAGNVIVVEERVDGASKVESGGDVEFLLELARWVASRLDLVSASWSASG